MAPEPARVLRAVSIICDAIFLLFLPARLYKLRTSNILRTPGCQGYLKAVGIPNIQCSKFHL
jgi:hypothetical protein